MNSPLKIQHIESIWKSLRGLEKDGCAASDLVGIIDALRNLESLVGVSHFNVGDRVRFKANRQYRGVISSRLGADKYYVKWGYLYDANGPYEWDELEILGRTTKR